jgi:PKD repeat protein
MKIRVPFWPWHFILIVGLSYCPNAFAQAESQPFTSSKCNEFTFDATGSYDQEGGKLLYEWNLGDGTVVNDPVVEHTYVSAGIYTVTLTVSDEDGLSSHSSQTVQVSIPPDAGLKAPQSICAGQELAMEAYGVELPGRKMRFDWDFGDGTQMRNRSSVTKTYAKGGNYKLILKADDQSDSACSTKTIEHIIKVNEPPVANAGSELLQQCVNKDEDFEIVLDAGASFDINADEIKFSWDFGDLSPIQEGETVKHRYKDFGVYEVKLIANDNTDLGCGSSIDYVNVQINEAPKAEAGEDVTACAGDDILFDGSSSYANPPGTLIGNWEFGDGQKANGLSTHHVYTKPGDYKAVLTVRSGLNASCQATSDVKNVSINAAPRIALRSPASGCTGEEIAFDASDAQDGDGDTLEFYWSFGDGTILRAGKSATHTYQIGGNYKVSVIVDDKKGTSCSTATASGSILINTPPQAHAGVNQSCCVDVPATFDASGSMDDDNDPLAYVWDFGDGTTATGAVVTHTYKRNGEFNVTLTVDDGTPSACRSATDGFKTQIRTTPIPVINVR